MVDTPVIASTTQTPIVPPAQSADGQQKGRPSTPTLALGLYKNTGIDFVNQQRDHVCDVPNALKKDIALASAEVASFIAQVRAAIEALFVSDAASPLITKLKDTVRQIINFLKMVNKILKFVNNVLLAITQYITWVRKMIAWILSLPAQLLKLFASCLNQLINALSSSVSSQFGGGTGIGADVQELLATAKETATNISDVTKNAIIVQANAQATASTLNFKLP